MSELFHHKERVVPWYDHFHHCVSNLFHVFEDNKKKPSFVIETNQEIIVLPPPITSAAYVNNNKQKMKHNRKGQEVVRRKTSVESNVHSIRLKLEGEPDEQTYYFKVDYQFEINLLYPFIADKIEMLRVVKAI